MCSLQEEKPEGRKVSERKEGKAFTLMIDEVAFFHFKAAE